MQGNSRCTLEQLLAVPLRAADERHAESWVLGGEMRAGYVVLQPGQKHQH
jgi:hypothetical protein